MLPAPPVWDDPFAIYNETNEASMLQPLLPADGDTLFLVVPTRTQQYEEDRENRIRIRYAIQRALIDQGFAAEPGYLLSSLEFALPFRWDDKEPDSQTILVSQTDVVHPAAPARQTLRAPVQFFTQRPLQARLFKGSNDSRFTCVAVIWLPEVHAWRRTDGIQNEYLDVLFKALSNSINGWRPAKGNGPEHQPRRDRWVFMGPSDRRDWPSTKSIPRIFMRVPILRVARSPTCQSCRIVPPSPNRSWMSYLKKGKAIPPQPSSDHFER
jgi:hypothetical protein